jgi:uncharacterized protein YqhQ
MPDAQVTKPYIGGQAVLEGVMMRAPTSLSIVLRRKDGRLQVRERPVRDLRRGVVTWPLIRGLLSFGEALKLGQECLKFSLAAYEQDHFSDGDAANAAGDSTAVPGEANAAAKSAASKPTGSGPGAASAMLSALKAFHLTLFTLVTRADGESPGAGGGKSGGSWMMMLPMVALMVALPQLSASAATKLFHLNLPLQSPLFQALTGLFKLTIVLGYMLALRRTVHVRRMFQYHGAEHKTISTYEAGEALTVQNARTKTTLHARCGTTFLVMVVLMSVFVFSAVGSLLPTINTGHGWLNGVVFFFVKLPFLPFIAALTFELQRLFAKYFTKGILRVVLVPGFLVQKITTIEPDDAQLEIALASLRVTLFREQGPSGSSTMTSEHGFGATGQDVFFADYESLRTAESLS